MIGRVEGKENTVFRLEKTLDREAFIKLDNSGILYTLFDYNAKLSPDDNIRNLNRLYKKFYGKNLK